MIKQMWEKVNLGTLEDKYRRILYTIFAAFLCLNFKMKFKKTNLQPWSRTLFQGQEQSKDSGKRVREPPPRCKMLRGRHLFTQGDHGQHN